MFLLVKGNSKYWRMHYRYAGKQKTLALGVYPAVSLALARKRREAAREQLAAGIDPNEVKRDEKLAKALETANTFELLARQWLEHVAPSRSPKTTKKVTNWLEHDVFPMIGKRPITSLKPRDILMVARKMEARGAIDSAHRVKELCGQVCRYCVALDLLERDITADLRGGSRRSRGRTTPRSPSPRTRC